jgi:hypothetical protein
MSLSLLGWMGGGLLLLLAGAVAYLYVTDPARRREQRIIRSCDAAFGPGNYRLLRINLVAGTYSFLERALYMNRSERRRPYTYRIIPADGVEPDVSDLSRRATARLEHFLQARAMPHRATTVVRQIDAGKTTRTRTRRSPNED